MNVRQQLAAEVRRIRATQRARPERVAPDEAFVLVAWRTVMVGPFLGHPFLACDGLYLAHTRGRRE